MRVQITCMLCCRGANFKTQPSSFIVLHRSLQLYPKGGSRSKSCAQLELWRWMGNSLLAVSHMIVMRHCLLVAPHHIYFPLLCEKLWDILPRLVKLQLRFALVTYEELQYHQGIIVSHSPMRIWLLPQIKAFYGYYLHGTLQTRSVDIWWCFSLHSQQGFVRYVSSFHFLGHSCYLIVNIRVIQRMRR